MNDDNPMVQEICLAWFRGAYRERPVLYQCGSDPGFWVELSLQMESQTGLIALSNAYSSTAWSVTDMVMDLLVGKEPTKPKRPITVPIGEVLASAGPGAAIVEYQGHILTYSLPVDKLGFIRSSPYRKWTVLPIRLL